MRQAIGFDVYGTLVDPLAMVAHLGPFVGDRAEQAAALWRQKQIEYAFRRGLMRRYVPFTVCTHQALLFTLSSLNVSAAEDDVAHLLAAFDDLPAFADALPALTTLKAEGHVLVAFSNGMESAVRTVLARAGLVPFLDGVLSVDDLRTFKPDPAVYTYLAQRLGYPKETTWLVSGNAWDVIGAKAAGLKAAWVRRSPGAVYDPWDLEPDVVVDTLQSLAGRLG